MAIAWKEPTTGVERQWGFDPTAVPDWFMVPLMFHAGDSKTLRLDFAAGKIVKSVNPRIVSIEEEMPEPASRFFRFRGKMPARARVEVRDPGTRALKSVLEVSVKVRKTQQIRFLFVEDRGGKRTLHRPGIADGLIDTLNGIFENQTNIVFEASEEELKIPFDLTDVVAEEKDPKTKSPTGEAWILGKGIWKPIFARNRVGFSDFNVYLVATDDPAATNRNAVPYTDFDGNCIIEDGREPLEILLPHAVGRLFGCPITTDLHHIQHLMFWNENLRRTGDFIPKRCANIMNPSGL